HPQMAMMAAPGAPGAAAAWASSAPAARQAAVRGATEREFATRGGATRGSPTREMATPDTPTPESAVDELLVVYHPSVHANATALTAGAPAARRNAVAVRAVRDAMRAALELPTLRDVVEPLGVSPLTLTSRVRLRAGVSRALAVQRLRADPRVRSVEPNARVQSARAPARTLQRHVHDARRAAETGRATLERLARRWRFDVDEAFPLPGVYPDAAYFVEQSWHYNTARFPQAWTVSEGSAAVIVAVVDDGMRFDHPAIAAQLTSDGYDFVSERSVLRCAGGTVSNTGDGDGYDADPTIPESWQLAGNCLWRLETEGAHGLHVATTISATANNGTGLVGGTAFTRIRPVRALGLADGTAYDVAQAILYAAGLPADDGAGGTVVPAGGAAHIINLSLGTSTPTTVMQAAVEQAHAAGVLLVAASGNAGNTVRNYPAAYPEVLSVTAVDPMLQRAWYASYGTTVDIAAPGGDVSVNSTHGVRSAAWDFVTGVPTTGSWNGTSMAAPHVSAAAALLKAVEPALTASTLRTRLLGAVIDLGAPGPDVHFGAGLLNVESALLGAPTRALQVVLVDATTGAERARMPVDASGAYRFAGLPDGAYWVFAGTDERGDGRVGLPGRVWGAAGGGATPSTVVVDGADTYDATFTVTPTTEVEPNNTVAQANVLRPDGYVLGTISATNDADMFAFLVTDPGTYRLSVVGQIGACGFARETDGRLSLLDGAGQLLERSLNVDTNAGNRCASITRVLAPGTYRVIVEGSTVGTYLLRASARPAGP
ncbi:MAG TPA: S8 family serine peptidase, partial [Gemmatimonadaceae bacterium]|nr:S8 family serine peptidase [Gemmatimonadaceae bacterium]